MEFTAQHVNSSGMNRCAYVDGVTIRALELLYPQGVMEGYYSPDDGYDSCPEIGFVDELGNEYYVYARFGNVRVGSHGNFAGSELLAKWLTKKATLLSMADVAINRELIST